MVALLKKAGASTKLTYLIIGEALINDGSALVLYNLFVGAVYKDSPHMTALDITNYFVRVIFISPLLGAAFGFAAVLILILANHHMSEEDTTVQVAITLCCAYLSFLIAEWYVGVSGVICCCSAALVLAAYANPLILHPHTMNRIWV